jgi:hypothetical protein
MPRAVRMMWRRDGDGEIYLYSPKDTWTKDLCDTPGTRCNTNAGMSLMRGAFKYPRNEWVHLGITGTHDHREFVYIMHSPEKKSHSCL